MEVLEVCPDPFPDSDPDATDILYRINGALFQYHILPLGNLKDMIALFDFFAGLDLGECFNHGQFHPKTCPYNHCLWSE